MSDYGRCRPGRFAQAGMRVLALGLGAGLALSSITAPLHAAPSPMSVDVLITGGRVVDGTGSPAFRGDIAIKDGLILAVGRIQNADAKRVIDATGLVVAPGFIDIHSHSDRTLTINRLAESAIRQGWTTLISGNCGSSQAPGDRWPSIGAYLQQFEEQPASVNVADFVGHGNLRRWVMGTSALPANEIELDRMKRLLAEAMQQGALGLSVGLSNPPGTFANRHELVELAKVVSRYGGLIAWHQRSEGATTWVPSILEALEVAELGGVRLQLSHLTPYYPNWGRQQEALDLLIAARKRGVDVATDVPPYLRGVDPIHAIIPEPLLEGGLDAASARLRDPATRARVRHYLAEERKQHRLPEATMLADGLGDRIWVKSSSRRPEYVGKTLTDIGALRGTDAIDAAIDLMIEDNTIVLLAEFRSEEDIQRLLADPLTAIEADEAVYAPYGPLGEKLPHPRAYGTAPMAFRKYVRGESAVGMPDEKPRRVLSLEETVRKMTSLPAQRLGFSDRGQLREGFRADVVVFDPDRVRDQATWIDPHRYPLGVPYVLVNGVVVVDAGRHSGRMPGLVIRGPGYAGSDHR